MRSYTHSLRQSSVLYHRGCKLHYEVVGSGEPVLFIQGVGVHGDGWLPQIDALSSRYQCLSFDNRGIGRSQPVGELFSIEQMAEDAAELMAAQGWSSAHVVGHSMGGLIALHLALSARTRVRSLSLLCTFARGADVTSLSAKMLWLGMRTRLGTRAMRRRAFLEMILPPSDLSGVDVNATADRFRPLFGHDLAEQPPICSAQLRAMRDYDASPRLRELAGVPTLVVSANEDPIARIALGRSLAQGIPGARYIELANASHGVPMQSPARINDLLEDHLSSAVKLGV